MTATRRRAWGKYEDMNEDSPDDSPYEMLARYDQSETKRDRCRPTTKKPVVPALWQTSPAGLLYLKSTRAATEEYTPPPASPPLMPASDHPHVPKLRRHSGFIATEGATMCPSSLPRRMGGNGRRGGSSLHSPTTLTWLASVPTTTTCTVDPSMPPLTSTYQRSQRIARRTLLSSNRALKVQPVSTQRSVASMIWR
jgi:hypothetical protein